VLSVFVFAVVLSVATVLSVFATVLSVFAAVLSVTTVLRVFAVVLSVCRRGA
jgi:hypothetical protein